MIGTNGSRIYFTEANLLGGSIRIISALGSYAFFLAFLIWVTINVTAVQATTFKELETMSPAERDTVITNHLSYLFELYNSKDWERYKAQCLIDLNNEKDASGKSKIYKLVYKELSTAKRTGYRKEVEGAIARVVGPNCPMPNHKERAFKMSAKEYGTMQPTQRGEVVQLIVNRIDDYYSKKESQAKWRCLTVLRLNAGLKKPKSKYPDLVLLISEELARANFDDKTHLVKDVVFGVIENACKDAK